MQIEDTYQTALESNVLETDQDHISVSDRFMEHLNGLDEPIWESKDQLHPTLEKMVDGDEERDILMSLSDDPGDFLKTCVSTAEMMERETLSEVVGISLAIDPILSDIEMSGVPESFVPIRGEILDTLRFYRHAILYVWREDCAPCDLVKDTFEALFGDNHDDVSLFAINGPNYSRILESKYDAVAAPLTLFLLNGRVDARMYGALEPEIYEKETQKLKQQSA